MAAPRILVNREASRQPVMTVLPPDPDAGWAMIGWIGWALFAVGAMDLGLAWLPPAFGSAGWEFGTLVQTANGLPLPAMGLLLALASGIARRSRLITRSVAVLLALGAVVLLAMTVLFVTVAPIALGESDNALVRTGLLKAILKTSLLLVGFATLFIWTGVRSWARSSASR